jgi:very-short-patch-repair endonuclease
MDGKVATTDGVVAGLASVQHGVVSRKQLLEAGLSEEQIDGRVRRGGLYRMHRGVYAVGHPGPSRKGRWMAAVLAATQSGRRAHLSHRSAAELWGLLSPGRGLVDVILAGDGGARRRRGVRIHRSPGLKRTDTTHRYGIPVTTPRRTIEDLRRAKPSRGGANAEQLRRAIRQAAVVGLPADDAPETRGTRSDLELLFLEICRTHRLPAPEVNVEVATGIEVDFLWRRRHLVVETDSYRYHRGRVAFENDHDRDVELRMLGFDVLRFSEKQLQTPHRVVSVLTCQLEESAVGGGWASPRRPALRRSLPPAPASRRGRGGSLRRPGRGPRRCRAGGGA